MGNEKKNDVKAYNDDYEDLKERSEKFREL